MTKRGARAKAAPKPQGLQARGRAGALSPDGMMAVSRPAVPPLQAEMRKRQNKKLIKDRDEVKQRPRAHTAGTPLSGQASVSTATRR